MSLPDDTQLYDVIDGTWPAVSERPEGPWIIREGQGGGQRVSATVATGPVTAQDLAQAETAMQALNQPRLFQIRAGQNDLDSLLEQNGYVIVDPVNHRMTVVNAGHLDPVIRDANGVREISREIAGLPIGILEDFEYEEMEFAIDPQTTILLYTDGISEAMDTDGNQFGIERVRKTAEGCNNSAKDIGLTLVEAVSDFEDATVDNDDTCLVCFGRE